MAKRSNTRKRTKKEEISVSSVNSTKVLFTVIAVAVFLLVFYFLTLYITSKNSEDTQTNDNSSNESSETVIPNSIILGRSLSMSDSEYLVIFFETGDEETSSTYESVVYNYQSKEDGFPLYVVDMSSGFNKNYLTDGEANMNPTTESEILVHGPTLMHIQNGQVIRYLEGEEAITSYLK